ncbi:MULTISPECIES: LysR family transcriptional regulator [unclassified Luteococcus]|uniref:LysR family transcriptional regulator n=1 Tax=unclassified Luteococcus TaxID=2639923 RepID=UPI00313B5740
MDLHALRCFLAVVEEGTVTAGAERLGIGQPAVSRQIRQLERSLRMELFRREEGRLHLTPAGRGMVEPARVALRAADEVRRVAREVAAGHLQEITIATTGTTRDDVIAPWLASWPADAPLPSVVETTALAAYQGFGQGVDLAIGPRTPPPHLARRRIADLPLLAHVQPGHPWAGRGQVPLHELADVDLLLLNPTFHARQRLDQAMDAAGVGLAAAAEFSSPIVAQAVAASGRGVCVLSDDSRFGLVPLLVLDEQGEAVTIRLHAAWERHHHAAHRLSELASDLYRFARERYPASR